MRIELDVSTSTETLVGVPLGTVVWRQTKQCQHACGA